jgi:Flp pilus assembly protein TadD
MSGILPVGERLLAQAQRYRQLHQHNLAVQRLRLSAGFVRVPAQFREVHVALADSYARLGRFRRARQHLKIALSDNPADAELHARLGRAWVDDVHGGDRNKGLKHLRRAVALDPHSPSRLRDLGQAFLACGHVAAGLKKLEQAWTLAPDDFSVLEELVDALLAHGRLRKAERILVRARFRFKRSAGLAVLHNRVAHARAARLQRARRRSQEIAGDAPVLLPFLRVRTERAKEPPTDPLDRGLILRLDAKSPAAPRSARHRKSQTHVSE